MAMISNLYRKFTAFTKPAGTESSMMFFTFFSQYKIFLIVFKQKVHIFFLILSLHLQTNPRYDILEEYHNNHFLK